MDTARDQDLFDFRCYGVRDFVSIGSYFEQLERWQAWQALEVVAPVGVRGAGRIDRPRYVDRKSRFNFLRYLGRAAFALTARASRRRVLAQGLAGSFVS